MKNLIVFFFKNSHCFFFFKNSIDKPFLSEIEMYLLLFLMQVRPYKTEGGEELLILQEGIRSPAEVFRCSILLGSEILISDMLSKLVLAMCLWGWGSFDDAFFRTEQNNNRTQTWLYRLGGWLAMFLGLTLLR